MSTQSPQTQPVDDGRVRIDDPRAMRALAHPVRMPVMDELFYTQEAVTATALAKKYHISPSAMSYHLRTLEKWGFARRVRVPQGKGVDGRERLWAASGKSIEVGSRQTVGDIVASQLMQMQFASLQGRLAASALRVQEFDELEDAYWGVSSSRFPLSNDQQLEFSKELESLVEKYKNIGAKENGVPMLFFSIFAPDLTEDDVARLKTTGAARGGPEAAGS